MPWGKFGLYWFLPTFQHVQTVKDIYIHIYVYILSYSFQKIDLKTALAFCYFWVITNLMLPFICESFNSPAAISFCLWKPWLFSLIPSEYQFSSHCDILISFLQTQTDVDYCCSLPFFPLFRTKSFTALHRLKWVPHQFLTVLFF